jgi:hypothetical protein
MLYHFTTFLKKILAALMVVLFIDSPKDQLLSLILVEVPFLIYKLVLRPFQSIAQ